MSTPPRGDFRHLDGPFDIIGDIHGCAYELQELLRRLGYELVEHAEPGAGRPASCWRISSPEGRRIVFVGDYVDRGPSSPEVLRLVIDAVRAGVALGVVGNHDDKLARYLKGNDVQLNNGLAETVAQMKSCSKAFHDEVSDFLADLPLYLMLDGGALVVAHAGIKESMIGLSDYRVRHFCLYGDTDPGLDSDGLPLRYNWAAMYSGPAFVAYGHTPVENVAWQHNTACLDTGCCYGGALSALRWPEREIVSVKACQAHAALRRPMGLPPLRGV
jgi:protein phosphatase